LRWKFVRSKERPSPAACPEICVEKAAASLFYLPSQATNPKDSFFWDFKDGRAALDPTQWIEHQIFVAESFKIIKSAFQEKDRNGALLKFHRIEVVLAIQLTMVTLALNRIAMFNKKQDLS
jgi:hypothetical protein